MKDWIIALIIFFGIYLSILIHQSINNWFNKNDNYPILNSFVWFMWKVSPRLMIWINKKFVNSGKVEEKE